MAIWEKPAVCLVCLLERIYSCFRSRTVAYWGCRPRFMYGRCLASLEKASRKRKAVEPDPKRRLYEVDFKGIEPVSKDVGVVEAGYSELGKMREYWVGQYEEYAKRVPFGKGVETILDIGCGTGSFAAVCKENRLQVLSMDLDLYYPNQSIVAERGLLGINWSARAACPFVGGAFDAVHSHDALFFFNPAEIVFMCGEWERILRPGGFVIISLYQCSGSAEDHEARVKAIKDSSGKLEWETLVSEKSVQESTGQRVFYAIFRKPEGNDI